MNAAIHVGQLLQPFPAGIGRYVEELVAALPAAGCDVTTFAAGDDGRLAQSLPAYRDLGWPHGSLRYELWHRARRWPPKLPAGVDVVHAPSLAVPPRGARALVVTVHDIAFLHYPQYFTRRGVAFHRRGLELARRDADAVIVPSEHGRAELEAQGFGDHRVHVVPHGVRIPPTPDDSATTARLTALRVERPFVLFVGTVEPRKGIGTLLEAVRAARGAHPDLTVVLAGPAGWGTVDGLDAPWIRRLGRVDDDTLDALYRRAVACALPSRYEGFGFPVVEAMARGCPMLASNTSSLPEVAGDGAMLLDPRDADAWTAAILSVCEDTAIAARLSSAGVARARELTWERSAAGHVDAYRAATRR